MNYRQMLEDLAVEATRNTLTATGLTNPTPDQIQPYLPRARRTVVDELARTNPALLRALRDELAERHAVQPA
jgi:hypothetical protein